MKQHLESAYGNAQTIRYLVNSLDDLREVAQTVLFIVRHNCEPCDYRQLKEAITLTAIPMPQSLSSFIIGFDVPTDLLTHTPIAKANQYVGFGSGSQEDAADCQDFPEPSVSSREDWHHVDFHLTSLSDLLCAIRRTMDFLRGGSEGFEYVNLKRRTRLLVTSTDSAPVGFKLTCKIPGQPNGT